MARNDSRSRPMMTAIEANHATGTCWPVPICPRCERAMQLSRVALRVRTEPETHTYRCGSCGEVLILSEDD